MAKIVAVVFGALAAYLVYKALNCELFCQKTVPNLQPQWWGPGKQPSKEDTSIRPFTIRVSDKELEDLTSRLKNTRYMF